MKAIITGIQADTLTPFAYHSLMVQSGTATLPELVSDHALMFGLASTLGMMRNSVCLPEKDYRRDLEAMPCRGVHRCWPLTAQGCYPRSPAVSIWAKRAD